MASPFGDVQKYPCESLHIVAGVLTIPFFYYLMKELTGSKLLALLATILAALDHDLTGYSMDVRSYSMVILFTVIGF